jgi:hypothetical protein
VLQPLKKYLSNTEGDHEMQDHIRYIHTQYLCLVQELQQSGDAELEQFTASDVERALWSSAAETMPQKAPKSSNASRSKPNNSTAISRSAGQKRKKRS